MVREHLVQVFAQTRVEEQEVDRNLVVNLLGVLGTILAKEGVLKVQMVVQRELENWVGVLKQLQELEELVDPWEHRE